jgi:hypothetical protein
MMLTCGVSRYQPERTIQSQLLAVSAFLFSIDVHPCSGGVGLLAFFAGFFPLIVFHDNDCCGHFFFLEDVACVAQNCFRSG